MASVRLTSSIREHVQYKLRELYNARIQAFENEIQKLPLGMETVLSNIPNHERELVRQLNAAQPWISKSENVKIRTAFKTDRGSEWDHRQVPIPSMELPLKFGGYSSEYLTVKEGQPSYIKLIELLTNKSDTEHEQKTLCESIRVLMNTCQTLRQVVEVWASVLDYIPADVRARHYEKTEKKEPKEQVVVDEATKLLLFKANLLKT